jgi:hypothetical protein
MIASMARSDGNSEISTTAMSGGLPPRTAVCTFIIVGS